MWTKLAEMKVLIWFCLLFCQQAFHLLGQLTAMAKSNEDYNNMQHQKIDEYDVESNQRELEWLALNGKTYHTIKDHNWYTWYDDHELPDDYTTGGDRKDFVRPTDVCPGPNNKYTLENCPTPPDCSTVEEIWGKAKLCINRIPLPYNTSKFYIGAMKCIPWWENCDKCVCGLIDYDTHLCTYYKNHFPDDDRQDVDCHNLETISYKKKYVFTPYVETEEPTGLPSISPTTSISPSQNPSIYPSLLPSKTPSTFPSISPSNIPTTYPTVTPSDVPSDKPSANPSISPSVTFNPTSFPSNTPSHSISPSESPTSPPSMIPSFKPSFSPSESPSLSRSPSATVNPSSFPTITPSITMSASPSVPPSMEPSTLPSEPPTLTPSSSPSIEPSTLPSEPPTLTPSSSPSKAPTYSSYLLPSFNPSESPIRLSDSYPSPSPSITPTSSPTSLPSTTVSETPSSLPTALPTTNPSRIPTSLPTTLPSNSPFDTATKNPSKVQSSIPSGIPTKSSSSFPSPIPSRGSSKIVVEDRNANLITPTQTSNANQSRIFVGALSAISGAAIVTAVGFFLLYRRKREVRDIPYNEFIPRDEASSV